jgi:hypothetical protein
VPIKIPIGAEENFQGVIDLIKMKAIFWDEAKRKGMKFDYREIPAESARKQCEEWRENMLEAAAESSEEMMNKYLEVGDLTEDEIKAPSARARSPRNPADAVRHRVQEQGRAAHARRRDRLHAVADRHSAGSRHNEDDQPKSSTRKPTTTRSSRRWRSRS